MTAEIISDAQSKFNATIDHLNSELAVIRSSQTTPSLIEDLPVNAYDGSFPLKELAAISVPDSNVLLIQPWDQTIVTDIEEAIQNSKLGLKPAVDGTNIRLNIPALSQERREEYVRRVSQLCEEAKVSIRNVRQDKMKSVDGLEVDSLISEDERDRAKKQVQDLVEEYNQKVENIKAAKETSLMEL
ncbi:ribosome recycling factor [candidate division WWE3 bacterium]|uniref:Ribosome-recycling factor n=1 Tax=candidate division WWE3 bacterium TaxID=2053526 RepID=A0A955LKB6_UNCKA|nr:ribosome recycling factor [candidate division WWE3 bacterium]